MPGLPASVCRQIQVHDVLYKVEQTTVSGWDLEDVCTLIKGVTHIHVFTYMYNTLTHTYTLTQRERERRTNTNSLSLSHTHNVIYISCDTLRDDVVYWYLIQ